MKRNIDIHDISKLNFDIEIHILEEVSLKMIQPEHKHNFYEIILITEGVGVHQIDFKNFELKNNQSFFLTPGQVYNMENLKSKGYIIAFSKEIFTQIQSNENTTFSNLFNNNPIELTHHCFNNILTIISLLFKEKKKVKPHYHILRSLLTSLLLYYKEDIKIGNVEINNRMILLSKLIESNFVNKRETKFYAQQLNISIKHLNDLTKDYFGKSVLNLLHERLILESKRELLFTNKDVKEIAYDLDFNDPSYFNRFFKKHVGHSPEDYRKSSK